MSSAAVQPPHTPPQITASASTGIRSKAAALRGERRPAMHQTVPPTAPTAASAAWMSRVRLNCVVSALFM